MKVKYREEYGENRKKELSAYIFENLESNGDNGELENMKDEILMLRSFVSMIMDHMCEKNPALIDQIGIHFDDFDLKPVKKEG